MSAEEALAHALSEIFARETALFEAYEAALHSTRDPAAREAFMRGQLGCARARGRLMAEMERLSVPTADSRPDVRTDLDALRAAEEAQLAGYREASRLADAADEARLGRLVALHVREHEERLGRLERLGRGVGG